MRAWNRIIFYIILLVLYLLGYNFYSVNAYADNSESFNKNEINSIKSINVTSEGLEIISNQPIDDYKTFTLSKPQRLVLDVYNTKTTIAANVVPIKRFGIRNARIGIYSDKIRIVFDSFKNKLPKYRIEKTERGISVLFNTKIASNENENVTLNKTQKIINHIESIDFNISGEYSRITIKSDQAINIAKPVLTGKTLIIVAKNSVIGKNLQRPLNTKGFPSSVLEITPYQVRMGGEENVKILIKMQQFSPYEVKNEGNILKIEVQNLSNSEPVKPIVKEKVAGVLPSNMVNKPVNKETISKNQIGVGKKVYTGARVTLEFADADIRKIFQLIGEVSNLNFILGDDVKGTISIKLVNVPWDQALDVILDAKGLGMQREGNVVLIRPIGKIKTLAEEQQAEKLARERAMELKTKVFDVNFASVSDIAKQFNSLKSERGMIAQDDRTNRVIVTDIEPAIDKMTALLRALDIPEKQVMIEARIVEASSEFTRDLGVQWGVHYLDGSASFLGISQLDTAFGGLASLTAPTSGVLSSAGGAMGISFGRLSDNVKIDLRLSAAESNGQAKIISTPKVVTLNNKAAKISQGQSIPYQTTSAEGTKTEFVEAALTLEVTPHITANGDISMKIKASNNSPGTPVTGSTAPPINKKEATTELLVKNGETTVIGGIYVDNSSITDAGVPFLKDIPLLGWLFKSNINKSTKTELLIFITPKIVGA